MQNIFVYIYILKFFKNDTTLTYPTTLLKKKKKKKNKIRGKCRRVGQYMLYKVFFYIL